MTTVSGLITFGGAFVSGSMAVLALLRTRRSALERLFALGMLAFAVESAFSGFCLQADAYEGLMRWMHLKLVAAATLPGAWLLFGLCYARENYKEFVARWKWAVIGAFAVPVSLVCFGSSHLFVRADLLGSQAIPGLRLGWAGYLFHLGFVLAAVAILAMLEKTLRASYAKMRWRIKFMVLGIGGLFAIRIYTATQALLFSFEDLQHAVINSGALLVADAFILLSLLRSRLVDVRIQVSPALLRNSLTVLIVGVYLLVIGLSAKLARTLGIGEAILQNTFFVFLAIMGLVVILLSDQLRNELRRFLARHFRQPLYDYRRLWTVFTQRTTGRFELQALSTAVVNTVSETFGCSAVSIWLVDEGREHPQLCCSTFLSPRHEKDLSRNKAEVVALLPALRDRDMPVDLNDCDWIDIVRLKRDTGGSVPEDTIRYAVPLAVGSEFLGLMTLNERMTGDALSIEDLDLLKTMGDQTAGLLLNCRLYGRLGQAKEREAFQTLSAFFVHDLKNLASTLSLTLQSMPLHYDNPEFRDDMIRVITRSLEKISTMCSRLATFKDKLELQLAPVDLGELVAGALAELNGSLSANLIQELEPLPSLLIDAEQIQKVLLNLVLNASEATGTGGEVRVATRKEREYAAVIVTDNGGGMSAEFLQSSLFHAFKTTKERGLGIGLYQSKIIVEAHGGRIEVESEVGRGATFRVLLPLRVYGEQ